MTKKSLPPCVYKNLKKWIESFDDFKLYGDSYCKKIHKRISDGDNFLSDEDKFILKNLFSSQIINKDNLFEYFLNFEDYSPKNDIESSVIKNALEEFKFKEADKNFKSDEKLFNLISIYEKVKAEYIQKYFKEELKVEYPPDAEQAEAIGAIGKNILVSARAGSGKTQTIAGKVAFLVNKYDINPEDILVLCFNKSASESMKKRIQKFVPNFENAKTFHGWAMGILFQKDDDEESPNFTSKNSILVDEKGAKTGNNLDNFLKKIIDESEGDFKNEFYKFLKISPKGDDVFERNKKSYEKTYKNIRNHKKEEKFFPTLAGIRVRSLGEKWIMDFLLENGIKYTTDKKNYSEYQENVFAYEKYFESKDGGGWFPDFKITKNKKCIIWEHWAIKQNGDFIFENYKIGYNDKRKKIKMKGYEFEEENDIITKEYIFLETKSGDIQNFKNHKEAKESRKKFEYYLAEKLKKCKIKLPNKEEKEAIKEKLIKEVYEREKDKGFKYFISFINYVQQKNWSNWENEINKNIEKESIRARFFIKLAIKISKLYFEKRDEKQLNDFNKILKNCGNKIRIEQPKEIQKLKYILIDEFQDFSPLFQYLIDSIRSINSQVNLFCVGDDWQLINGFAGSDISLFQDFKDKKYTNNKLISTCYRSFEHIVNNGNDFAEKIGLKGDVSKVYEKHKGESQVKDIIYKKYASFNIKKGSEDELDLKFKELFDRDDDFFYAKQVKKCFKIIKENTNKSILILTRNNSFGDIYKNAHSKILNKLYKIAKEEIQNFDCLKINKLKDLNKKENKDKKFLAIMTMHKSKGLEADIVILLNVCDRVIPSIHPTNELFEIFGRTPDKILDEEKRLFYVAITRAKEKLFILTQEGKESEFII